MALSSKLGLSHPNGQIVCCGLSTLDLQLHGCQVPLHLEHITQYSYTTTTAGGSVAQTSLALSALCVSVSALTVVGDDTQGEQLKSQLQSAGVDTTAIATVGTSCTSVAVLPLFADGRRGCFVTLGANSKANVDILLPRAIEAGVVTDNLRVFHFGYPHLMTLLQGRALHALFDGVRDASPRAMITLDVNGASKSESEHAVLRPALRDVTVVHANLEEAVAITGLAEISLCSTLTKSDVRALARWFVDEGAAITFITCGRDGVFVATTDKRETLVHARVSSDLEISLFFHSCAFRVADSVQVNASGAGDAFMAGIIAELGHSKGARGITRLTDSGLACALSHIDSTLVTKPAPLDQVVDAALQRERILPDKIIQLDGPC